MKQAAELRRQQSGGNQNPQKSEDDKKIEEAYDNYGLGSTVPRSERRAVQTIMLRDIEQRRIWQDEIRFAKQALMFTNEFRNSQGKGAVLWNEVIAKVCYFHSRDMGMGKQPVGHANFEQRTMEIRKAGVGSANICENVAYTNNYENCAKVRDRDGRMIIDIVNNDE